MILQVRVSFSVGLPISRLKKLPGILPTEYNLSWYSMVRGRKPISGLFSLAAVAATSTTVSSYVTKTDPFACLAILPLSILRVRPPISASTFLYMYSPSYMLQL
jgi:hypothetical protein